MLLRAPGAVNFSRPRPGWLFEWVVTRIGRGAKKGVATVLRDSGTPREGRRSQREIYNGWQKGDARGGGSGERGTYRQGAAEGEGGAVDVLAACRYPWKFNHAVPL